MIDGLKVAVVLPAYNASETLERTYAEIPHDIVDEVILVDDASTDQTASLAQRLGIHTIIHARNGGYGANQKTCYTIALAKRADIVVMLHPDYQYTPKLVTAMAGMIASGHYDAVFASRILGGGALSGGMPRYKYVANRLLTAFQNLLMGAKLSELPRLEPADAGATATPRLLGRFRVRQSNDRPSDVVRICDRRNFMPDQIFPRGVEHQLPSQLHLQH